MSLFDKEKLRNIVIAIVIILFSRIFLTSLFEFTLNKNVLILIVASIVYLLLFNSKDSDKLPRNAFLLIVIFGSFISVVKPVQYGLDEESPTKRH